MNAGSVDDVAVRFDNCTVVVTGVGREGQVGDAVAREFAKRGAAVAIIHHDITLVEERAAALRAEGLDVRPYACDLTDRNATDAVAQRIAQGSDGRISALANIAGGFAMSGPISESDPSVLERQLAINLGSAYGATRALLPALRSARGAIVYMAAAAILPGRKMSGMSAYVAAKSAVVALMRCVAQEEIGTGVRANALAPTAIRTKTNLGALGSKVPYIERESIAAIIAFLCSPAAANVNGQVIELT